ncbi:MAG TPA: arginine--tRNA ligase [Micropepsaceae bacterium]|nr:arginine--tRNA ligase [Micropepsaceae bacterium]
MTPMSLLEKLSREVGAAFASIGLDASYGAVQVSDRPDLAPFQCNGALAAAKAAKANPRAIAADVEKALTQNPNVQSVTLAGPGFINLAPAPALVDASLTELAARLSGKPQPKGETVVIDFGGPNVAKAMHVGHLRSSIIGDCLQRAYRFAGYNVVSDVHFGDWGKPMGQLITELKAREPGLPYFDETNKGPFPAQSPVTMEDLEVLYPAASAACKADPARDEAARLATVELQRGRPGYRALWKHFLDVSVAGVKREFASLGVHFDEWKGESDADPLIAPMLERLKAEGLAVMDEGALVMFVAEEGDKKPLPPLILVNKDGGANYEVTDLATIVDRIASHDPALILYVVDHRQHDHFERVFRAARKGRVAGKAQLEHVGFGTINGTDNKPFKTRAGGVVKLFDLIEMATAEALKRIEAEGLAAELAPDAKNRVARQIGIGAMKFADLANHRLTNYIFDLERFTRFEGKTGPYLQYAAVRMHSLLARAAAEGHKPGAVTLSSPAENELALALLRLPDALDETLKRRAPNMLCDFAFNIAQAYSRFYAAHHILSETDARVRDSRLGLTRLTLRTLEAVLGLLGIDVPEKM